MFDFTQIGTRIFAAAASLMVSGVFFAAAITNAMPAGVIA